MDGMDKATDRVCKAIATGETIWVHGDYDVDGTASTAMMLLFLRELGEMCSILCRTDKGKDMVCRIKALVKPKKPGQHFSSPLIVESLL